MKQETAKAFLKPTKIIWMIIPVAACLIFGTLIGNALGVLDKFPEYDIFLHLLSGILGVAVGYVFIGSGKKPEDKNGIIFVSFASLCFSAAVTCLSEICEFLYDFCMGTNYVHVDLLDDGHWFYRLFGKGLTELIPNQQRILDTDEDMLISVMAAFAATAVLYIGLRIKHKDLCRKKKKVKAAGKKPCLRNRIIDRLYEEKEKLDRECSIADIALWWSVRAVMIYRGLDADVEYWNSAFCKSPRNLQYISSAYSYLEGQYVQPPQLQTAVRNYGNSFPRLMVRKLRFCLRHTSEI